MSLDIRSLAIRAITTLGNLYTRNRLKYFETLSEEMGLTFVDALRYLSIKSYLHAHPLRTEIMIDGSIFFFLTLTFTLFTLTPATERVISFLYVLK